MVFRYGARVEGRPLSSVSTLLDALGRAGPPARDLAPRLDLIRSIGAGYAWREHRRRRAARVVRSDGRRPGYVERWCDAANQIGARATDLSRGFVEICQGDICVVVWNHWVPFDDIVTLKLALEKPLVHQRLASAGLPVPEHELFDADDLAPAVAFMRSGEGACVVKPVDSEGGRVTTTGIRTPAQLRRARLRARRISRRLLIERQVPGDNYRFLFLDGRLLDVVRRRAPSVVGDGRLSVRELMVRESRRRSAASVWSGDIVADLDTVFTLENAGLSLDSVPGVDQEVVVKTVINANGADDTESVRREVSAELTAEVARAAAVLGVRLAGVDVITRDCQRPLAATGGVILEVNATPGLHYHYDIRNPEDGVAVMEPILQALFAERRSPRADGQAAVLLVGADY